MLDTPQTRKYERRFELDGLGHPVVVIESDDWCACETVASAAQLPEYYAIMGRHGIKPTWVCGLEKADEILQLADLLEKMGSQAPDQGSNPCPLQWQADSSPWTTRDVP